MKKALQGIIVISLLGLAAFVFYKFFILPKENLEALKQEAGGKVNIDVAEMIKRPFRIEQKDILTDERFVGLTDHSVTLPEPANLKPGRKNPFDAFEANKSYDQEAD